MMTTSIRVLAILTLFLSGGWLVHKYSMHYAQAEIYYSYSQQLRAHELKALDLDFQDYDYRSVVINGQLIHYRRAYWAGSPETLLDQLETQINRFTETDSTRAFIHAGKDGFFVGRLPHPDQPEVRGFMLKATRQASGTQVWIWDFGNDLNADQESVSDVGLPSELLPLPGSLQLFFFHDAGRSHQGILTGFSAPGSVGDHVKHYDTTLGQAGFKPSHPAIEVTAGNRLLQYKSTTTEISITISPSENKPGQSIDIIQFRKQG